MFQIFRFNLRLLGVTIIFVSLNAGAGDVDSLSIDKKQFSELVEEIVESNMRVFSSLNSIEMIATRSTNFDQNEFDGLKALSERVDFFLTGEKYLLKYDSNPIPPENKLPNFVCIYDGEKWGRFEDGQHKILFISKSNQPNRVALGGTIPLWEPFLPLLFFNAKSELYRDTFVSDLSSSSYWASFMDSIIDASIMDSTFGKLVVLRARIPNSNGVSSGVFTVAFSMDKGFFPVQWNWLGDDGSETEYFITDLEVLPTKNPDGKIYFPKKGKMVRLKNNSVISTSESIVEELRINNSAPENDFLMPIEEASSIYDLDEDIAIPIPN